NAANNDDPKCWQACYRITRRGNHGRADRDGGRTRGRSGDQGDGRIDGQDGHVGSQGSEVNDGVNGVLEFSTIIAQQLQNLLPTIVAQVGNQGRGQGNDKNQNGDAVNDNIRGDVSRGCTYKEFLACNPKEYDGKGGSHMVEFSNPHTRKRGRCRFHELARLVPHLVTPKGKRIERSRSIKKNPEKRGNRGEPSRDKNVRDDNKRTRTRNIFATTANPVRREYMGMAPKCTTCNYHHSPETPCRSYFNCNCLGYFAKNCRVAPRNVNPVNARNLVVSTCYECSSTDHIKSACPMLKNTRRPGVNHQNQVMAVNREIDKVIRRCTLEIEGHVFDINLIPFGSGNFDVIIRIDWLSDHKDEIICHEKVVRIPLLDGKVLRVLGEKPNEKMRQLMSAKSKEKKQEEIIVVKDFPEVFPDDLERCRLQSLPIVSHPLN
nr:putative reverse transcriptase domain-containing protein [Tanacetum cinerariifolium]